MFPYLLLQIILSQAMEKYEIHRRGPFELETSCLTLLRVRFSHLHSKENFFTDGGTVLNCEIESHMFDEWLHCRL